MLLLRILRAGQTRDRFGPAHLLSSIVSVVVPSMSLQAQTVAGRVVTNVADARYSADDAVRTLRSNADVIIVAERLDVVLAEAGAAVVLTNAGNGSESFVVGATGADGSTRTVAIDRDGDGVYDPARDVPLDAGRTPTMAPGAALYLLVPGDDVGALTVVARAVTGSGAPGTTFAGQGDGGGDAVVGATGAVAQLAILRTPSRDAVAAPVLTKSQSIASPDGGTRAIRGATVTYALDARFAGATRGVRVDDVVPGGARYVAGSLTLDGEAISDTADGDAGAFDGTAIHVALGDVPAGAAHTITFKASLE